MITKAYLMRGMGDALNSRDFLLNYCEQKHIPQEKITVYTSLHKQIFEDTKFKIEKASKCDYKKLRYYAGFGHFDLPKDYIDRKFDTCIAHNGKISYSFEKIKLLKWSADISNIKLPEKFVTVNYGHDNNSNPMMICSKMWLMEYWEELVSKIGVDCVQIGGGWSCKDIKGVKLNLVNKLTLKQSAEVMKRALFHIDIEGGLVILGKHIGVKSVVLFGATDINQFARKGNLNLRNSKCISCHGNLNDNFKNDGLYVWENSCNSRCMKDLTPNYVIEQIYTNGWL